MANNMCETRCIMESSLGVCVATVLTRISFFGRRYRWLSR